MAKDYSVRIETNKNRVAVDSDSRMVISTDNALCCKGEVSTDIVGRTFEISGKDVLRLQALLAEKKITTVHDEGFFGEITYVIVGENAESKEVVEQNIELDKRIKDLDKRIKDLDKRIKEFNKSRHWWERKLKV